MIDFPASPTVGQIHAVPGGPSWKWDGSKWISFTGSAHQHVISDVDNLQTALNAKAPLDGTGATGTWPISINGNAATATTADSATSATTATSATNAGNANTVANRAPGAAAGNLPILDSAAKIPFAADKVIISTGDPDPGQGDQNWLWIKVS